MIYRIKVFLVFTLICVMGFSAPEGSERGGSKDLDGTFKRKFEELKDYFVSGKIEEKFYLKNNQGMKWLQEPSKRNKSFTNYQQILYFIEKEIELKFLLFLQEKGCETEEGYAAVCYEVSEKGKPKIEVARSRVMNLFTGEISVVEQNEAVLTYLLHEFAHLAGEEDHQYADSLALQILKASQLHKKTNAIFYKGEAYKIAVEEGTSEEKVNSYADFVCQYFNKKSYSVSWDLIPESLPKDREYILLSDRDDGRVRFKVGTTTKSTFELRAECF